MIRIRTCALMLAAAVTLAACENSEERAERYYQSALELFEEGKEDQALLELRNVFQHDGFHREARQLYAEKLFERGELQEAYSQYLRLVEQYPDIVEARIALAEISLAIGNSDEFVRHGEAAAELDPENPKVRGIGVFIDYQEADQDQDEDRLAEAVAEARAVLEVAPENLMARNVVIFAEFSSRTPTAALDDIKIALEIDPSVMSLHGLRFRILRDAGLEDELDVAIQEMYAQFPDDPDVRETVVTWYVYRQDLPAAEALLREFAGDPTAETAGHITVIDFLSQTRGVEAAEAEIQSLIDANVGTPNGEFYQAIAAQFRYEAGDPNGSIPQMEGIIAAAEETDQTRDLKVLLARMLVAEFDVVGARTLVEEVLVEDSTHVEALKMRAAWFIDEDRPDDAIADLRTALNQEPEDPAILTLMGEAQMRAGNMELASERFALAVEVSGQAPAQSLRYAQFLRSQSQEAIALNVLTAARRATPGNVAILTSLAEIWLNQQQWDQLADLKAELRAINTEESNALADDIAVSELLIQDRAEAGLALLEEQLSDSADPISAAAQIVLLNINTNRLTEARRLLEEVLLEDPDNEGLQTLEGMLLVRENRIEEAEARLVQIVDDGVESEVPVRILFTLYGAQGRLEDAKAVLAQGLEDLPNSVSLLAVQGDVMLAEGDIDGAIAALGAAYEIDSNQPIVANNLASLLATYSDDPEDLDRAYNIARRLRGFQQPALQDTYGWIEYRRGNYEDALPSLEFAAEGLPEDGVVQIHLGLTYMALERLTEARSTLEAAMELVGDLEHPDVETAKAALEALPEALTEEEEAPEETPAE